MTATLEKDVVARADKSAPALVAYLKDTGTGQGRLAACDQFLAANPGASAESLFLHLRAAGVALGTLRKAGKFVYGEQFDLADPAAPPTDEVSDLRRQNAELLDRIRELEAQQAAVLRQNKEHRLLQDRNDALTAQVNAYRARDDKPRAKQTAQG